MQISLPKNDPVYVEAERIFYDTTHDSFDPFQWLTFDKFFPVQVTGVLRIDKDGTVTGAGTLQPFAGLTYDGPGETRSYAGHVVECPEGHGDAIEVYDWDLPVHLHGTIHGGDRPDLERTLDLTTSFGYGATTDSDGRVGGAVMTVDTFDQCPKYLRPPSGIPAIDRDNWDRQDWPRLRHWPERHKAITKPLYQQIAHGGPYSVAGLWFPPTARETGVRYTDGTTNNRIRVRTPSRTVRP